MMSKDKNKEYNVMISVCENGECVDVLDYTVHPLIFEEIKQLLEEHEGDNKYWVSKR